MHLNGKKLKSWFENCWCQSYYSHLISYTWWGNGYKYVPRVKIDLSAKVAHIGILSKTVKTPYNNLAKMYTNYFDHVTKMATSPIYALNSSSPEPEGRLPSDLVCSIEDVYPNRIEQMMILGWPWHGQILFLMHLFGGNLEMLILL